MVDPAIVARVQEYLRRVVDNGIAVSFGVVFGSFATGQAGKWSDIDLVVVSPRFDDAIARDDVNRLWRVAARVDSRIEPFPCGERQWREDDSSVIIHAARAGGALITLEPMLGARA